MCPSPHRPSEAVFVCRSSSQQGSNVHRELEKRGKERGLMYKYDIPAALYLRGRSTQHKNGSTRSTTKTADNEERRLRIHLAFLNYSFRLSTWKEILFDAGMISKFR